MFFVADIAWRPALIDSNLMMWCVAGAHVFACWCCVSALRRHDTLRDDTDEPRPRRFWWVLALVMFGLALNTLFDLQTLLTMFIRDAARRGAWYGQRRFIQAVFVCGFATVGLIGAAAGFMQIRYRLCEYGLAYLSFVFLLTFVAIRTASFHYVDVLIYYLPLIGNWMNVGLELTSSLLVSLGAIGSNRQLPPISLKQQ